VSRDRSVICDVPSSRYGFTWSGALIAEYEVSHDPISDDFTPDETSADNLFTLWVRTVERRYPDGTIPIFWSISCAEAGKFEYAPFQSHRPHLDEDFLTFYDWPIVRATGRPLDWRTLPIRDKGWNRRACDKGGFIPDATGWRPHIYQPSVSLPMLQTWRSLEQRARDHHESVPVR
jgi:hypothetical protein